MSYLDNEISVHDGKPVELFKFEGTYANFFYTSGPKKVEFDGDDYLPVAIRRSEVKAGTQEDDGLDVSVELPASSPLSQTYAFSGTPPKLTLTIFRYHRDDIGDWRKYWFGPINNALTADGKTSFRSPSALANALQTQVPNVYYQAPCNHVLFNSRCKIVEADWTVATTVVSVDGKDIEVASVGAFDGQLIGGEVSLDSGERRMIVAQTGSVVTVNFPFFALIGGTDINIVAGCDHKYTGDCKAKFANQRNFGAFPFIPNENVFDTGLEPGRVIEDGTCLPVPPPEFDGWDYEIIIYCTHIGTPGPPPVSLYIRIPGDGCGGSALGGAYGSDFAEINFVEGDSGQQARRILFDPVGDADLDTRGDWCVMADGEAFHTYVVSYSFRHWSQPFAGLTGPDTPGAGDHVFNVHTDIDWREFR